MIQELVSRGIWTADHRSQSDALTIAPTRQALDNIMYQYQYKNPVRFKLVLNILYGVHGSSLSLFVFILEGTGFSIRKKINPFESPYVNIDQIPFVYARATLSSFYSSNPETTHFAHHLNNTRM